MIETYELTTQKVGIDVMSYSIWIEYIMFLKTM